MSAAEVRARIGTAGLDEEANEFRAQIRSLISASVPPGLADMAQRNKPGIPRDEHATAMARPEYREWEQQLLDAQLIFPSWPAACGGSGFTPVQMLVFAEECVRAGVPRVERGVGGRSARCSTGPRWQTPTEITWRAGTR